jgi:uncharacterized membrane protein YcaP (DUF421 family)
VEDEATAMPESTRFSTTLLAEIMAVRFETERSRWKGRKTMETILTQIFGGDIPQEPLALHQIAARAFVVYAVGVALVRIGKSRLLSRINSVDVILGFVLGSLLSRGITGHASLSGTAAGSAALIACHWVYTAAASRSHWLGSLVKGHSVQLISDGKIDDDAMRRSHLSYRDLFEQFRLHGVETLDQVESAFKERNGEVSVIKRPRVMDVSIEDGVKWVRISLE